MRRRRVNGMEVERGHAARAAAPGQGPKWEDQPMSTTEVPTQPGGPPTATRIPSKRISSAQLEALAARVRTEGPREHMEIQQPFNGGLLACVPRCALEDVVAAITRAR